MSYKFTQEDISNISKIFGEINQPTENNWIWQIKNIETQQQLVVSLYNEVQLGEDTKGSLLSVQTLHGYFEIHNCIGYLVFEPDEVIFINSNDDVVSCMIVGRQGTCSMYSNIRRELLHADFTTLDPAVLLSAMQLSLTEGLIIE